MKRGPVARLGLIAAIVGAVLLTAVGPAAAGGCGQWGWTATQGRRVGDPVRVWSGPPFGGLIVDVRLGSTIVVTAPMIGGEFDVTFTIPGGTPAGDTTLAARTRVTGVGVNCDWQVLPFTVEPSVSLSSSTTSPPAPAQTTTTTAAPTQTSSTTPTTSATLEEEAPVTSTSTSAATTTTVVSTESTTTVVAAAPLSESSGSGGLPSILVVLLGAAGGTALFVGGMLFERKTTGSS